MPNKPGNDDRSFGGDREREREVSNESNRATGARQRSARGFASMDRSKQREIASKGGKAAHAKGTAHEFDSGEAREAGRKGGMAVSRNREHMAAIGRRGGEARGANRAARLQQGAGDQANAQRVQSDRDVGLAAGPNGQANAGGQSAPRPSGNSLGGERRPSTADERNIERP